MNEVKLTNIERSLKDEVKMLRTQYKDQLILQVQSNERFKNEFNTKINEAKEQMNILYQNKYQATIADYRDRSNKALERMYK